MTNESKYPSPEGVQIRIPKAMMPYLASVIAVLVAVTGLFYSFSSTQNTETPAQLGSLLFICFVVFFSPKWWYAVSAHLVGVTITVSSIDFGPNQQSPAAGVRACVIIALTICLFFSVARSIIASKASEKKTERPKPVKFSKLTEGGLQFGDDDAPPKPTDPPKPTTAADSLREILDSLKTKDDPLLQLQKEHGVISEAIKKTETEISEVRELISALDKELEAIPGALNEAESAKTGLEVAVSASLTAADKRMNELRLALAVRACDKIFQRFIDITAGPDGNGGEQLALATRLENLEQTLEVLQGDLRANRQKQASMATPPRQ